MKTYILIIFALLSIAIENNAQQHDINNNQRSPLSLRLVLCLDSLSTNNKLLITLIFQNTSNETISFYPVAPTYLINSNMLLVFGDQESNLPLETITDLTNKEILRKGQNYKKQYIVCVKRSFFKKGMNKVFVSYRFNKTKFNNNEVFSGKLNSNEVVFVLNDDRGNVSDLTLPK